MRCLKIDFFFNLKLMVRNYILLFILRKMTFGRVSDLGQFIRESEPEPDVKKSKGLWCFHT